ncbi:TRAP transporter substrate-binding protein [Hydrogenophaga sp. OTU3427]|uniref:TRAP transporter substrate-binding protein n=1 Tax=Hydrogenophaga sp. OTU3427 TaxID=3043856 RepID=UPI00313AE555
MRPLFVRSLITLCIAAAASLASAQDIQDRVIKFGHLNNTDHPVSLGVKRFGELVAAKSGGKLKVQEFPSSTLGNEMQQQSALQGGVQEMTAPATTSLAGIVKEFGLIDFPFSVANFAQADALLDGPFGQALLARLPEKGLVSLGYWDLGFRNATNSRRAITKVEDFEGLKLRVIPNPVFLETFKALKANPVPMAFGELYGALEARAVDGQENPFAVILSNKFYEVQKFVSATNHVYAANILLVSKRFWDRLSPVEQRILHEAADESRAYQRQASRAAAQKAVAELQAKGMAYNELSAAEQRRIALTVKPVTDKLAAGYDAAVVKLYNDELARVQR